MKENLEGGQEEQTKETLESSLREKLTQLATTRKEEKDNTLLREKQLAFEAQLDDIRTKLQNVMGETEADRLVLDLREEILGENFD
jgi:hypothetical protein